MTEAFPPAGEKMVPGGGPEATAAGQPSPIPAPPLRPRGAGGSVLPDGVSRRAVVLSGAAALTASGGSGYLLLRGGDGSAAAALTAETSTSATSSAASGSGASVAAAASTTAATPSSAAATTSAAGSRVTADADLLIGRATYGRTAATDSSIERLGATAWLERQLSPATIKDSAGAAVDAQYPHLQWSIAQARANLKIGSWDLMSNVCTHHLGRAMFSDRELFEVMVDFWSNHLNITCPSSDVWESRHRYQHDVIRKHALGSFQNLLLASAFHPSMLTYLDNAGSTKDAPNENYAREVLELHTVGVNSGYTEKDIQRAALLLTGWQYTEGERSFAPDQHYTGQIRVFGFSIANRDAVDGPVAQRKYLRYLATHPKTARSLATKLATHFVSDDPPAPLISRLAKVYTQNDTKIVPVLRALFTSAEFAESAGEKIRRPMDQLVASARAIGVKNGTDAQALTDMYYVVKNAGQAPLGWSMPNGYPDTADAWQSPASALNVFNSTTAMVHGWWPTKMQLPGPEELLEKKPTTRAAVITAVGKKVFGRAPTERERSAATKLLAGTELSDAFTADSWAQHETIALTATLFLAAPAHLSV